VSKFNLVSNLLADCSLFFWELGCFWIDLVTFVGNLATFQNNLASFCRKLATFSNNFAASRIHKIFILFFLYYLLQISFGIKQLLFLVEPIKAKFNLVSNLLAECRLFFSVLGCFRENLVTYAEILATFQNNLASFCRKLATFSNNLATSNIHKIFILIFIHLYYFSCITCSKYLSESSNSYS